jgi:hypothetical protein
MAFEFKNICLVATAVLIGAVLLASNGSAQDNPAGTFPVVDGDPIYEVLPPGAIPAIMDPVYVTGEEARRQMSPDEPVMGILYGGEARAYSLWQLDAHEIVNDEIVGTPIAVTW